MTTIDVGGQTWRLETFESQSRQDGAMGRSDSKMGVIRICRDIQGDVKDVTIIHEWLHGLLDVYGLEHPEALVSVIANELFRTGYLLSIQEV